MELKNIEELRSFLDRCFYNVEVDYKNDFVGLEVYPKVEKAIQEEMAAAGFHEFLGEEKDWPSLFLSVDEFKERPYFKNIHFDGIKDGSVAFEKRTIPGNQLFNVEAIVDDPFRELSDSMTLRALDKSYDASVLTIDGDTWMLDVYSESFTIDPCAEKAHGKVATLGLGIGYFIFMAMLNPKVESITVVELDPLIIRLFKEYIEPQLPNTVPLTIIEADAKEWFTKENVESFDYVFVDTYQSSEDGYEMMEAMLSSYIPNVDKVDFWIENSCIEFIRSLIVIYFDQVIEEEPIGHIDEFYNSIMLKIDTYFSNQDIVIDSEEVLKDILYSREVIREIIGINYLF